MDAHQEVCPRCTLLKLLVEDVPGYGWLCTRCAEQVSRTGPPCSNCGVPGEWSTRHPHRDDLGPVCNSCALSLAPRIGTCSACNREHLRVPYNGPGGPICGTCYLNNFPPGICGECREFLPLPSFHPSDAPDDPNRRRICRECYKDLIYPTDRCPRCKEVRELKWRDPEIQDNQPQLGEVVRICGPCFDLLTKLKQCANCENEEILRHVHPEDRALPFELRRHICRKCYGELTGYVMPEHPRGRSPLCPPNRAEQLRVLARVWTIDGTAHAVCRQCCDREKRLGTCAQCLRKMILWNVHPCDRSLPKDMRRRVCKKCNGELSQVLKD